MTLATSIGLLVAIAVGVVFWVQWSTAQRNTIELVTDRANLYADQIIKDLDHQLQPARHQSEFITGRIERGEIDPADAPRFETALVSSLAAAPQILSIAFVDDRLQTLRALRGGDGSVQIQSLDRRGVAHITAAYQQARATKKGFWGEVLFVDGFTLINRRIPIRRDGKFLGVLATLISVTEVSGLIEQFTKSLGGTGFVLYGRDKVLAHPTLKTADARQSPENPLLSMNDVKDPVLNALALQLADPQNKGTPFANRFERRPVSVGEENYVTFVHWINTYGETPWGVGAWLNSRDVDIAKRRVLFAGYIGIGLFLISLVAAVIVGKSVARPVQRLTNSTKKIGEFDLSEIDDLPTNWIKELDEQAGAFNTMLTGLRSFETYVPKSLVNRLIKKGGGGEVESQEKELTVMFTDIVGFTSMSEGQPAKDIADLINDHLAILGRCVEDQGGTIDKYIGDALMAFWGAPEDQPDTAARACRAALAMSAALEADNQLRKGNGLAPVRIRIGIHQGPVLVGNIGAPGRVNYTIIGDTVNTCQRIEALGKQFDEGADATILVSGAVAAEVSAKFNVQLAGDFEVKGKEEKVEVHRLID
ncbi:MAG: adenylate/guanylate cyclase domain-containing protein [Rhodospirillales bacterium]|nr:adenylate/guanylate cyclase domain-containing protein [Rhodospirillales bacterium]MDP6644132.1 adenylate/guanylate cyclase domain-containing protein [Rhodospirillales bacterium]